MFFFFFSILPCFSFCEAPTSSYTASLFDTFPAAIYFVHHRTCAWPTRLRGSTNPRAFLCSIIGCLRNTSAIWFFSVCQTQDDSRITHKKTADIRENRSSIYKPTRYIIRKIRRSISHQTQYNTMWLEERVQPTVFKQTCFSDAKIVTTRTAVTIHRRPSLRCSGEPSNTHNTQKMM